MRGHRIKIYSELTVSKDVVQKIIPNAVVVPPIKRGDIIQDIKKKFDVIAIVDGVFFNERAVSPGEIMDALRVGIRVYGSSSMGALRAAELQDFGMIGIGQIFQWINQTSYFKDDELGQTFDKVDGKIITLNLTYADFRFSLLKLLKLKKISQKQFDVLTKHYQKLFYPDRNFNSLKLVLQKSELFDLIPIAKKACLNSKASQKFKDAVEMLKQIKRDLDEVQKVNRLLDL